MRRPAASTARQRANRLNAQKSTGPRTGAGKASVRLNALQHGLTVPPANVPGLSGHIDRLADVLAGPGASEARRDAAWRVAEAQIDVARVRRERLFVWRCHSDGEPVTHPSPAFFDDDMLANMLDPKFRAEARGDQPVDAKELRLVAQISKLAIKLSGRNVDPVRELARLDRYERGALARRKRAIRDFDALASTSP